MPLGKGKYDDLCTKVREDAHAVAALVIVIRGNKGDGFSLQTGDLRLLQFAVRRPHIRSMVFLCRLATCACWQGYQMSCAMSLSKSKKLFKKAKCNRFCGVYSFYGGMP